MALPVQQSNQQSINAHGVRIPYTSRLVKEIHMVRLRGPPATMNIGWATAIMLIWDFI